MSLGNKLKESMKNFGDPDAHKVKIAPKEERDKIKREYWDKLNNEEQQTELIVCPEKLYRETKKQIIIDCARREASFITEDSYEILHKYLCLYFARDERFKKAKLVKNTASLDKGMLIHGTYGYGKTSLMKTFKNLNIPNNGFGYRSCYEVKEMLEDRNKKIADVKSLYTTPMMFDELGKESKSFGVELMVDVLARRYDVFKEKGIKTHITTNLTPYEIGRRYGRHIESRLKEMFNIIEVKGLDKRK
jgi:DNA replication protein DnaC